LGIPIGDRTKAQLAMNDVFSISGARSALKPTTTMRQPIARVVGVSGYIDASQATRSGNERVTPQRIRDRSRMAARQARADQRSDEFDP
jgi:hypothetical protein